MNVFWEAFWLFLPAGLANGFPVVANKIPLLNHWRTPMDFGKCVGGKRIFGANKTWRGLLSGTLIATVFGAVSWSVIGDQSDSVFFWMGAGAIMGFGALLGDAVESFFKRRHDISAGQSWFPFDQIDYIIGGLLLVYPLLKPRFTLMLTIAGIYLLLHVLATELSYRLNFRARPTK